MKNLNQIEASVRFHNYHIAKEPLLRIFVDSYFKFYTDKFKQFELFHQYAFGKEYNTDDYTLSKNSIKKPEIYWFKPETFIGYRFFNNSFVPFFINVSDDHKYENAFRVSGFSTYDENKYFFHYQDCGLIEDKHIIIPRESNYGPTGDNMTLYDNIQKISQDTEKKYFELEQN